MIAPRGSHRERTDLHRAARPDCLPRAGGTDGGVHAFARDLAAAGGSGLITPDLIPDEAAEWLAVSDEYGLDRVFLVAPSSTDARIAATVAACRGFVYATSVMGVTGARETTSQAAPALVARVRQALTAAPADGSAVGGSGNQRSRGGLASPNPSTQ